MAIGAVRTEEKFEFVGDEDQAKLRAHIAELATFPTASISYRWAFLAVVSWSSRPPSSPGCCTPREHSRHTPTASLAALAR
jgi:hypothetical protein